MSQLLAAVMNTTFALGSVFLPGTIEKFGRRGIMMYSAVGLTICMTVFVAMIGTSRPSLATQWTAVAAAFLYNFIFGYGWIGVCWLYGPEVLFLRLARPGDVITLTSIDRAASISPRWRRGCCVW